jgi:hypothetical protein
MLQGKGLGQLQGIDAAKDSFDCAASAISMDNGKPETGNGF